jgi:superoxide reductase
LRSVQTSIAQAIREYNKYHSPEGETKLVSLQAQSFQIEFTGSFCYTCGYYDYFDDYRILLEENGLTTRIADIVEIDAGAIVTFEIPEVK